MSIYMGNETGNIALLGAVRIQNLAEQRDHAKREIVAARFFEVPAEAIQQYR